MEETTLRVKVLRTAAADDSEENLLEENSEENAPRKKSLRTLFLFDLDDTLFPTSLIKTCCYLDIDAGRKNYSDIDAGG